MESTKCDSELAEKLKQEGDENDTIKSIISTHPSYTLLLQSHINCLQVCGIGEYEITKENQYLNIQEIKNTKLSTTGMLTHSDLDLFMEQYCSALGKLKEAIEEPQQKTMAFITKMHSELFDLTTPNHGVN